MATPIATGALKPKVAVLLAAVPQPGRRVPVDRGRQDDLGRHDPRGPDQSRRSSRRSSSPASSARSPGTCSRGCSACPSSSSHALFGGLIGATLVGVGAAAIDFGVVMSQGHPPGAHRAAHGGHHRVHRHQDRLRRSPGATTRKPDGRDGFRWGQIFTSSLVALAHGTNDAQKTMGVITLAAHHGRLAVGGDPDPQTWVIFACAITIALGTYMGGWRIIRTLGKGLTDVKPAQGFSAETSTAATILASSALGFALSTTQVASGSVIGSGLGRRGSHGALAHRRPHHDRLAADAPRRRCRRRRRGAHRRLARRLGRPRSTRCSRSSSSSACSCARAATRSPRPTR